MWEVIEMKRHIEIGGRRIGAGESVYIVAEMSANHNQNFEQAVEIVHAAKKAGADAVKLQTYTPDTMTLPLDDERFQAGEGTPWEGRSLYDIYEDAYMPWEWQPELKTIANGLGLDLFSTPFDSSAVDFLETLNVPAYKVASFEIVDIPLIERIARTGRPIIFSTGMSTVAEIEEAIRAAREAGATQIALLKCTSAYPSPPEELNLLTIPHLMDTFVVPVGLSDHSLGIAVPVAAVALGACIVEKHFTLSQDIPGPDSSFSLEPQEFKTMVDAIRTAEKALGEIGYETSAAEAQSRVFRRSLFVVKDIKAGETFTDESVRSIRPGIGLHPRHLKEVLGQQAARDIKRGTPLAWELIS